MPPTTPRCAGSDGVSFAALRAAMPVWRPAFLARISHTHGPKRTPGNRNLLTRKTVTREARIPTDLTACRIGNTDSQLVAVKEQVFTGPPPSRWCRRSGSPHRENWADLWPVLPVGAGTARRRRAESRIATHRDGFPSRRCPHPRRWRFRARPRFRSVSIAPLAPLRGAVPTGGRPSSPGGGSLACASLRLVAWAPGAMFSVRVAPSATRRALPRLRDAG